MCIYTQHVANSPTEVPKQVCMTKDNVSLHLNSVIYYRITSPHKAAFGIANIRQALIERTQTTLRHVIGARVLQDVIERREEIAQSIREIVEETAAGWGVDVESMLIKDIIFSQELQDSLSMAAQSKRTGEAKVIAARAEVESAKVSPPFHRHILSTTSSCTLETSSALAYDVSHGVRLCARPFLTRLGRVWAKSRVFPSTHP